MSAQDITRGIAIIGLTTAAHQLLDAARLMRTDEAAALDKIRDAIAVAAEAYDVANPTAPVRLMM